MRLVIAGDAFAHDDAAVVDRLGDGEEVKAGRSEIAHGVEIEHLTVDPKKRVDGAIGHGREPNDHPRRVSPERAALISSQSSEIDPRLVGAQESMVSGRLGNIGRADNVRYVVPVRGAARATERAEILYSSILINEGVKRAIGDKR